MTLLAGVLSLRIPCLLRRSGKSLVVLARGLRPPLFFNDFLVGTLSEDSMFAS